MKIAVASLHIGKEYARLTRYSALIKEQYCRNHGYDYIQDETVYDSKIHSHPAWAKLSLILRLFSARDETGNAKYPWVVWIDADLYIMNLETKLESFISRMDANKHIQIGSDFKMTNTGIMFIRNCEWSHNFLSAISGHTEYENRGNYEQDAFQSLHEKNYMNASSHILVAAPRDFNSYWFNWEAGDFILHFAGCKSAEGLDIQMRMYCPVRRQDDDDESYESRMIWLKEEYKRYRDWRMKL